MKSLHETKSNIPPVQRKCKVVSQRSMRNRAFRGRVIRQKSSRTSGWKTLGCWGAC